MAPVSQMAMLLVQKLYPKQVIIPKNNFVAEFGEFILGTDKGVETTEGCQHRLRNRLIERCDHLSEEVCVKYKSTNISYMYWN